MSAVSRIESAYPGLSCSEMDCCKTGQPDFAGFHYCPRRNVLVDSNGIRVSIRHKSLAVFLYLAKRANQVVDKEELIAAVWDEVVVTDDSLTQCIADIRRAIGDHDRQILRTEHRRGYCLVSRSKAAGRPSSVTGGQEDDSARKKPIESIPDSLQTSAGHAPPGPSPPLPARHALLFSALVLFAVVGFALVSLMPGRSLSSPAPDRNGMPTLAVLGDDHLDKKLLTETRVALSRYKTISLIDGAADFELLIHTDNTSPLDQQDAGLHVAVQLKNRGSGGDVYFADTWKLSSATGKARQEVAERIAAAVASPGGGAIGTYLLASSRSKPVDDLTRAECYAHGYACRTCSGEEESITPRAQRCLDKLLRENPGDARAWALKSVVLTRMKWFGVLLSSEQRGDPDFQQSLVDQSIEAASKAESLSDGTDTAIYWGMAQAYVTSCQPDKLLAAIENGLKINPNDPALLGSFGNWLAYSGHWDRGVSMVERAVELEPRRHKKYWLFAPAKRHFFRGDYEAALQGFMKAYNERNWLSHLQLAYTLPYLGRLDEANREVAKVSQMFPGMTRATARKFYSNFCFEEQYLQAMDKGLEMAGMLP